MDQCEANLLRRACKQGLPHEHFRVTVTHRQSARLASHGFTLAAGGCMQACRWRIMMLPAHDSCLASGNVLWIQAGNLLVLHTCMPLEALCRWLIFWLLSCTEPCHCAGLTSAPS
jgi:hypothetical protein